MYLVAFWLLKLRGIYIMNRYIKNTQLELITEPEQTIVFSQDASFLFFLHKVEKDIWNTFSIPWSIEDSYTLFSNIYDDINILDSDYRSYVEQLYINGLLIRTDD